MSISNSVSWIIFTNKEFHISNMAKNPEQCTQGFELEF